MRKKNAKNLVLIDGNAIMHRAYHALPPLTTKKGELVNAVYGFASTLLSVLEKFHPEHVAVSFDLKGPTFRHKEYKEYKATRVAAPDEFYAQIPRVKEFVRAFNIPIYEQEGFEADDVIGTIAKQASEKGMESVIVTGDLDTLQLINDSVRVYALRRGISDTVTYDRDKVMERYGLEPSQIVDLKGLAGDPSDNIPGVKGIGQKTAATLLQKYRTVEGVYENITELKGAVKTKLERDKAQALLSKQLATIATNVPVAFDREAARLLDYDRKKIVALLTDLNFYSLVKRLPKQDGASVLDEPATGGNNSTERVDVSNREKSGVKDFKYVCVADAGAFLEKLKANEELGFALNVKDGRIVGVAFSWDSGRAGYLPFGEGIRKSIAALMESNAIRKVGYDLKEAVKVLRKELIALNSAALDVLVGSYMLNPGGSLSLEHLILSELGEEVPWSVGKKQLSMLDQEVSNDDLCREWCAKADYMLKLSGVIRKKIDGISSDQKRENRLLWSLGTLFSDVEMPLIQVLAEMELRGVKFDRVVFDGIVEKLSTRLVNLEKALHELAGKDFNANSSRQLAEILFSDLKLSTAEIRKGKTGYSTASSELEKLRGQHPIIEKIEEYRELFKLKTTYLDTLPKLVTDDGRIHSTFNQAVTATGRLSSTDPNLQNIPIRTDLGQIMRTAFIADDGWMLVSADYSQIDLRAVAHVSGDKNLTEAFHRGDDIHRLTASVVNGVTPSQVSDKMRRAAKALNFGIIYGMGAFGFANSAGLSREEAQKFIDEYFERFSGVANYMKGTKEFAKKNGYVETILGRRRYVPEINSPNFQVAASGERMAINMPIQGLSADIVKLAMVKLFERFRSDDSVRMILQIHDEIIFEVKEDRAESFSQEAKEIMEGVIKLAVPLVVDVKCGRNWGEI